MKKKIRYASVATVATIVCIVAAILINILFTSLDKRFDLSADFSGSRITGIDSVSVDIVGRLPYSVEVIVNGNEDDFRRDLRHGAVHGFRNGRNQNADSLFGQALHRRIA